MDASETNDNSDDDNSDDDNSDDDSDSNYSDSTSSQFSQVSLGEENPVKFNSSIL